MLIFILLIILLGLFVVLIMYKYFIFKKRFDPITSKRIYYIKQIPFPLLYQQLRKIRFGAQILFGSIVSMVVLFIVMRNFTPLGAKMVFTLNEDEENMSELGPKDRVKLTNGIYSQSGDLIYFTTFMPYRFDKAKIKITFKNTFSDQEIYFGFKDKKEWHYESKVFHAPFIDSLTWSKVESNIALYQRDKTFEGVEPFLKKPPIDAIIGLYALTDKVLNPYVSLPDYIPSQTKTVIDTPLRGSHTIYVYLKKEPFKMTFYKQDLNWYEGEDIMNIKIYKDDIQVYEVIGNDDGISDASKKFVAEHKIEVNNPGIDFPESGVYKIVISAPGDVIIKRIETNLSKIVFADSIFPIENRDIYGDIIIETKPTIVYSNALVNTVQTFHKSALQVINFDDENLPLEQVNNIIIATPSANLLSEVKLPKSDVTLRGILGYFAFSKEAFFIPTKFLLYPIKNVNDLQLVDYVLTNYKSPKRNNEWLTAEINFNLENAVIEKNKLSWIISAPGLKKSNQKLSIKDIHIEMIKKPIPFFEELGY